MEKANYHIKEIKDKYEMSYSGDLREATEKARKDLDKALHDGTIAHWLFIKTMAAVDKEILEDAIRRRY